MDWSILIATHHTRHATFRTLVDSLQPQLEPGVEVVVLWNKGTKTIGEYRTELLEDARGEYVSFVDDDDRLPPYYVSATLQALTTKPDQVGWIVEFNDIDGRVFPVGSYKAYHSLQHGRWHQTNQTFYRDVSHLNPVRKTIAQQGQFVGRSGEDLMWADTVRGHITSEVFIPKIMYHYDYRRPDSRKPGPPPELPEGFRFHPQSEF